MNNVALDAPGRKVMLMGNEAVARGAIEAGAALTAGYPGNPSSEIIGTLAEVGPEFGVYVEWSTNEKVALEAAAGASFAGLRGLAAMKQNGLNVASDFLFNLNLTGSKGGLVIVVCDDPAAISSTNEEDTRLFARIGDLPLLEPADFQEAKDMTRWAFELSEELALPVLVRPTTRVSHARGMVELGEITRRRPKAHFDKTKPFINMPALASHRRLKDKLNRCRKIFEVSPFNAYLGPERAEVIVVASGVSALYAGEAIQILGLGERVGLLKLGASWPLPERLTAAGLAKAKHILVCEEVDCVLENNLQALAARLIDRLGAKTFHGRTTGVFSDISELSTDLIIDALAELTGVEYSARPANYAQAAAQAAERWVPARQVGFCAGCPHRATYWSIKNALALDGREGFVVGDIGCYSMGFGPSGFSQMKTLHAMGSGAGVSCGLGQLGRFGLEQPVLTVCGDSTFYHAALPGLINARYNGADFVMLILDNSATAMTGFQPHPGTGSTASGGQAPVVDIEAVCRALGFPVEVVDPFDLTAARETIARLIESRDGVKVLIVRQTCALVRSKQQGKLFSVKVAEERCLGERCGCNRLCTRVFKCPGLVWDSNAGVARIDEAICTGCGVCADICPASAITKEAV